VRVTVRLFARLREIAGAAELALDVEPPADIRAIWTELARRHPGLAPYASSISAARNMDYARMDTTVSDGDEIAFLPPVSGGAPIDRGDATA
jgi:molybdopterin converting factor subunit 1